MKTTELLKSLKMNKEVAINYEEAIEIMKGSESYGLFSDLHSDEIGGNCKNKSYTIEKTGKKGSILYPGSEYETKADVGIFKLRVKYDYIHPANFCQNRPNSIQSYRIEL